MRHLKATKKFGKDSAHRQAMWKNMTTSLIIHERIKTTDDKAKELRRHVAKMITLAKKAFALGDGSADKEIAAKQLHYRRQAASFLQTRDEAGKEAVKKLFSELAERFANRAGGYTRILKIGTRRGDAAQISFIELLAAEEEAPEKKAKPKKKAARPKKKAEAKTEAATAEAPAEEPPVEETPVEESAEKPKE
ncbi:MAG TPA: 50S ribosomal protein L17 [bacterium]|nr:50S ribosomal protein L17 [bacterium]